MESDSLNACALCHLPLSRYPILEGIHSFCCPGCHAVFNILTVKNQLGNFSDHPIFIQALRSGLISNPALLEHIEQQRAEIAVGERTKLYMEIGEMWCPSCAEIIRLMISKEKGVVNCVVDYATDLASIEYSPRHLSKEAIFSIISELGYSPKSLDDSRRSAVSMDLYMRFGVAAFCSLNIMMLAYPLYATYFDYDGEGYGEMFAWMSLVASLPVLFYSAWPIWKRFINGLKTGFFGMETLVAIGVASAFGFSLFDLMLGGTRVYFDSMSVIIVFVLLGKIIETKAKFSAKESLTRLSRETPRRARKRTTDGEMAFVPVKDIVKEDVLVALVGEKIALDGMIVAGQGACDESLMTGEAMPVVKGVGDTVLGGTILIQGHLDYRVTRGVNETVLHQIIEMIERDIGHKSIYIRAADRIVRWFVPSIVGVAILAGLSYWMFPSLEDVHPLESAWMRFLTVLLISCPCAIGIAAPAAESYLLKGLAGLGAIVRNRGCLPLLGKEDVIVFDKTGTVTEGRFKVLSGVSSLDESDRSALHALASLSTHPIACAVAQTCKSRQNDVSSFEEIIGHGIRGFINGVHYSLGSARFMREQSISLTEDLSTCNLAIITNVFFSKEGECVTRIALGDELRPQIKELVASMKPAQVVLLSGDAESSVSAVAKLCGFDSWHSLCTPLEKREFIHELRKQGKVVCMLGDGINDASALTASDVGISVVSASDISIQVSDLLLTTERLQVLKDIRSLAVKGQSIVRQNLFWAFFYNVIGILLAFFGLLSPIFAAFAMSVSSLTVLFNARRLCLKID